MAGKVSKLDDKDIKTLLGLIESLVKAGIELSWKGIAERSDQADIELDYYIARTNLNNFIEGISE
jgi:hypothetical protein